MKKSVNINQDYSFSTHSTQEYQSEDTLQTQYTNINGNNVGIEIKDIKKIILPMIFMVLLALICLFSYNFMEKLRHNQQTMMNIILSEQQNRQVFQDQINTLLQLKQEVLKTTNKNMDTQLTQKLQTRLKQFQQKIDTLQKRLEKLSTKTSEKQDVAGLAITQSIQIKKQLKILNNHLLEQNIRTNQSNLNHSISQLFTIPKNIWIFNQEYPSQLRRKYIDNIKFYGNLAEFTVHLLSLESANKLLQKKSLNDLKQAMNSFRQNNHDNSKQQIDKLQKKLILLIFLNEYGGIAMDGNIAMTEDIKWIQSIIQNKFVKRYAQKVSPQIVGFYRPEKHSLDINSIFAIQNIDKEDIFSFPSMEYFFLAAGRKTNFLPDYINNIYSILKNEGKMINQPDLKEKRDGQLYETIFDIAYQILLNQKQKQINSQSHNTLTAYDYYGLNLINGYYGPLKMKMIYELQPSSVNYAFFSHRIYSQIAHTSMDDYASLYGPFKYLLKLPYEADISHYLDGSTKSIDTVIYEDSVIQKIFYPEKPKFTFIKKNPFFSFIQTEEILWETLPKIIWIFQQNNQSLFTKLCLDRIRQMAKESLFEMIVISEDNLKTYLQQNIVEQIEQTIKTLDSSQKQIISHQLYKLAILYKHGGVFMNAATLAIDNFDWILKISNMPTQFIYNCIESHPKILMIWDPLQSQPQSWQLKQLDDYKVVKTQWNQAISDNFIAAKKNNELIKEWLQTMKELLTNSTIQITNKFKVYGLDKYGITGSPLTFSKDILRYVLAKKQQQISISNKLTTQNSASYYQLWTLNAFVSPYKLKYSFNYQNVGNRLNTYLFAYPQNYVQGIVGKVRYLLTFQQSEVIELDNLLRAYISDEVKPIFDGSSIIAKTFKFSTQKDIQNTTTSLPIQIS